MKEPKPLNAAQKFYRHFGAWTKITYPGARKTRAIRKIHKRMAARSKKVNR